MTKIGISASLERELRDTVADPEASAGLKKLAAKLLGLVEETRAKDREIDRDSAPGLSYQGVLRVLGRELGPRLVLPPKPTAGWIVRLLNRIKDLGLEEEHLLTVARRGAAEVAARTKSHTSPVEIEWLIYNATRLLHGLDRYGRGLDPGVSEGDRGRVDSTGAPTSTVITGRR